MQSALKEGLNPQACMKLLNAVLQENLSDNVALNGKLPLKENLLDYVDGAERVAGYHLFPTLVLIENCYSMHEILKNLR